MSRVFFIIVFITGLGAGAYLFLSESAREASNAEKQEKVSEVSQREIYLLTDSDDLVVNSFVADKFNNPGSEKHIVEADEGIKERVLQKDQKEILTQILGRTKMKSAENRITENVSVLSADLSVNKDQQSVHCLSRNIKKYMKDLASPAHMDPESAEFKTMTAKVKRMAVESL